MASIIMFVADWCGPCKILKPIVEEVAKEKSIEIVKVDADKSGDELLARSVRSVPTLIFVDEDGEELHRVSGVISKSQLEIIVDNL